MNIVLDLDGVLGDFASAFEKMFGGHITLPTLDITREQWKKIDESDFWLTMPLLPGGKYLQSLGEVPENVYILTSRRGKKSEDETREWFKRNEIDIPESRILFASPRHEKITVLQQLSPARFLDDSISNVDLCDTIKGVEATLMLQPYNGACALKYFPSMDVTNSVEAFMEGKHSEHRNR